MVLVVGIMRREDVRNALIVLLVIIGSFAFFYHGLDQVARLGLTHTLIISGEPGTADFTAASDRPIYISGYNTFDIVGEEINFTVTLYDDDGTQLAQTTVYLDSPGPFEETLAYHEILDYTLTPGEQYNIEVVGSDFNGVIEQPHTILSEFFLHWFYMGEIVGIIYLFISILWILFVGVGVIFIVVQIQERL